MIVPKGLSAFPITPCTPDGQVIETDLRRILGRLTAARVQSIGLLGSTGTYMYLTPQERRRTLDIGLDAAGDIPVVAGIGALRTDAAVGYARDAKAAGAKAGLLAAVSYAPLNPDEVFEHFAAVARESGLPIVIYDNPAASHFHFSPELIARLAQVPGIKAIKNPGGDAIAPHLATQRSSLPADFSIGYSGDWFCAEAMIAGADTWFSVLGGILPEACLKITTAARTDPGEARRLNAALEPLWVQFRKHGGLRVVYAIANMLGLTDAAPPRPILPIPEADRQTLATVLAGL
ncbi:MULTISPECIES: dihydrodipicolinate synthase family protein [Asticcacaulis]|uniref:dihydrodipicolinate synthase family protein n=1 Tax=Asticcacaulis TaxID=76890 RepID=UPI001AEB7C9A|nr:MULTISPECIES: dihydrodipicolinate synthase family protein [Asticcacaulis]MBP2158815.1 4-hydroxy-tetrahydrodipicolinate synthase [Asticcacaulis solisilvae]MDR6799861.1 4-hydroxy-tetrahydrodipicolinate synthase [Asticcacaulis sp. BE141]